MAAKLDTQALDELILEHLARFDIHPTNSHSLVGLVDGKWRRIDSRMSALKKAGRIRLHRGPKSGVPPHVKAHRWEVVG